MTKHQTNSLVSDVVRCTTNINAITSIRWQLENIYLSDPDENLKRVNQITQLLDEISADELSYLDCVKQEIRDGNE